MGTKVVTAYVNDCRESFLLLDALENREIEYIRKDCAWSERARLEAAQYGYELPFCVLTSVDVLDVEQIIERVVEND